MWRSLVIAAGLSMCMLGGEFMVVDRVVMAEDRAAPDDFYPYSFDQDVPGLAGIGNNRVFVPPDWAPWGLLSAGAMTVLYGATLPRR